MKVWLFPAPVKDSRQLSSILTLESTQPEFRSKLSALRAAMSAQLAEPTVFNGKTLCGNTTGAIVETIANVLNTGEAVRPKPAVTRPWLS